ncbi:MAG: diguanylate cyclase [Thermodesulfobacteriota bacterium]|nr:diguanylate cyclase [Thermodesulfobacteriota bacterium]
MSEISGFVERRKHPRVTISSGTAALLTNSEVRMGKIVDLSMGGVGFSYTAKTDEEGPVTGEHSRIDLLMHDSDFYIEKVPCRIISDFTVHNRLSLDHKSLHRCGIAFEKLTPAQKAQLEYQIQINSSEAVAKSEHLEKELKKSEEKYRIILESIEEGYFEVDITGNITFFNSSMQKMVGYRPEELLGLSYRSFTNAETARRVFRAYNKAYRTGVLPVPFDWELLKKNGEKIHVETSLAFIRNAEDQIIGFRGIARDVSMRKKIERELLYMASHDHLTGLYNRGALFERLRETIAYAKRFNLKCALLFLDLDNFKSVNDTYGHESGDFLLKEAAVRLLSVLRETDYICRHGGDEFTIILSNPENMNPVRVAEKVIQRISDPYYIKSHQIDFITTSVGISIYPDDGADVDTLVKHADKAMYKAKKRKNRYICFNKGKFTKKLDLEFN